MTLEQQVHNHEVEIRKLKETINKLSNIVGNLVKDKLDEEERLRANDDAYNSLEMNQM